MWHYLKFDHFSNSLVGVYGRPPAQTTKTRGCRCGYSDNAIRCELPVERAQRVLVIFNSEVTNLGNE